MKYSLRDGEKDRKSNICRRRRRRTSTLHAPRKYYPSHVLTYIFASSLFSCFPTSHTIPVPLPLVRLFQSHMFSSLSHLNLFTVITFFFLPLFQSCLRSCLAHVSHYVVTIFFYSFFIQPSLFLFSFQERLTLTFFAKLTRSWAPSVVTGSVERPTDSISSFPALLICFATPRPQADAR